MSEPTLSLSPRASVAELDGEAVVLDLESGRYFSVNRSGALLLKLLAKGVKRGELEAALVEAYRIDAAAAKKDAEAWISRLEKRGLLVSTPATPA